MEDSTVNENVDNKSLETKVAVCPGICTKKTTFTRVDKGIALMGDYRCDGCGIVYHESQIYPHADYVDLIKERLKKRKL